MALLFDPSIERVIIIPAENAPEKHNLGLGMMMAIIVFVVGSLSATAAGA